MSRSAEPAAIAAAIGDALAAWLRQPDAPALRARLAAVLDLLGADDSAQEGQP